MESGPDKSARNRKVVGRAKAREDHPSPAQLLPPPGQESEPDWITEEDAECVLLAVFSGKPWRFTPFRQIAEDCPAVWNRALEVYRGDRVAARKRLKTRSQAFDGKCPYTVALQVGGERKVLRELRKLC
jgi:hypothetical protein